MNTKIRTIVFNIAAVLLIIGAMLYMKLPTVAAYIFSVGSAGLAVCYLTFPTKDLTIREKRLHRFNILAALLCVFASSLMFMNRKEWIICVAIAAIFQLYSAFVTPKKI